jgi:hypothetical protein
VSFSNRIASAAILLKRIRDKNIDSQCGDTHLLSLCDRDGVLEATRAALASGEMRIAVLKYSLLQLFRPHGRRFVLPR